VELRLNEINSFFNEIDEIYDDRHQYNIEWAFENAQEKMDIFNEKVIDKKLKNKCFLCGKKKNMDTKFKGLQKLGKKEIKKAKRYSRIFRHVYSIITFLEIIISILLVLGLSHISHSGAEMIHSTYISLLFAVVFAFFKVVIERYFVKPRIDSLGWAMYRRSTNRLKELTVLVDEEATEVLNLNGEYEEKHSEVSIKIGDMLLPSRFQADLM
jgi:hypothetical protein